ncbi:hypothetical protein GQ607_017506 [Colletotrichum asianum]|nr:hypothetical protein GQ607_017506 [Colletotrichum asianum]
MFIRRRG